VESFRASLDLTRRSQGWATRYRATICGSGEVHPLGWHLSPTLRTSRVNQSDGVRDSAHEAVPPHIFVEGNVTWETCGPNEHECQPDVIGWHSPARGQAHKGGGQSSPCLSAGGSWP
jgi:hypothetical protein